MSIDVQEVITIHAILEETSVLMELHTHGLEKYNHPNFTVWAPTIYRVSAGNLLNSLANAIINKGEVFKNGENCEWREWDRFTLKEDDSGLLAIIPIIPKCGVCGQ